MSDLVFNEIKPGDIGFDEGKGIFGWLIRRVTGSRAHCWVYIQRLGVEPISGKEVWLTDEAGPRKVQERIRTHQPNKVIRLWRTSSEQRLIVTTSSSLLGQKYSWREIARLAVFRLTGKTWNTDPRGYICSGHVATCIAAARWDLAYGMPLGMRHPTHRIWPEEIATWSDTVIWRELVLPDSNWNTVLENW